VDDPTSFGGLACGPSRPGCRGGRRHSVAAGGALRSRRPARAAAGAERAPKSAATLVVGYPLSAGLPASITRSRIKPLRPVVRVRRAGGGGKRRTGSQTRRRPAQAVPHRADGWCAIPAITLAMPAASSRPSFASLRSMPCTISAIAGSAGSSSPAPPARCCPARSDPWPRPWPASAMWACNPGRSRHGRGRYRSGARAEVSCIAAR
jgi:hypothetical protein